MLFALMLRSLVVDSVCIGLLMFCTLAVDTLSIDVDDERIDVNVAFNVVDAVCIGR